MVIQRSSGSPRSDDVLSLPTADGGFVSVHPYLLRAPFTLLPEVVQYQIVHRSGGLLVRVVPRRRSASDLVGRVEAAVRRAVAGAGARIDVSVIVVDRIEREPGHAAKVKLVVSELPPPG